MRHQEVFGVSVGLPASTLTARQHRAGSRIVDRAAEMNLGLRWRQGGVNGLVGDLALYQ